MKLMLAALFGLLMVFSMGCASIVAPGQDRAALEESGGTKWAVSEYDYRGSHFVWVPTWNEGLLGLSTPTASNCKKLSVLEFKDGILVASIDLGSDREAWGAMLREHGRFGTPDGNVEANPLYIATVLQIVHLGDSVECVYFAKGFPLYGSEANPRCHRPPAEIKRDDVLYYLTTRGGSANEIVLRDGRVEEIRDAKHLGKDFSNFYHPIILN